MLVKAAAVLETWLEKEKGKMRKDDEIAEIGIVLGIDPATEIGTGIGTGIGIGIETGIGIGIVTIEEDRGQDHVIVMDIADATNIARGQETVVVHAHVPRTEVIVNDQEVARNVVQRATDHPNNRMPTVPTMTGHLVNTRPETELNLKQWRAIIMMIR